MFAIVSWNLQLAVRDCRLDDAQEVLTRWNAKSARIEALTKGEATWVVSSRPSS